MKKVLLAIGREDYSSILRSHFSAHPEHFKVLDQDVMHFQYLDEIIDIEQPNILILHDYYLPTDFEGDKKDQGLVAYIQQLRIKYDDQIRVVFLCERPNGDNIFQYLVGANVLDIFNGQSVTLADLIQQLKNPPKFANVAHLLQNQLPFSPLSSDEDNSESESKSEEIAVKQDKTEDEQEKAPETNKRKTEKKERPIVQKVVQKNVVNKQVIKRDYHIQILNQHEKVVGVPIDKRLVVVASPFPRSGSTFVSHLMAKHMADMDVGVTYIENPFTAAYSYDRFMGQEHAADYRSKFLQFTQMPDIDYSYHWEREGVNLIVKHPTERYTSEDLSFETFVKVLMSVTSPITIVDVGSDWQRPLFQDIYDIATDILFVLEPDISCIQSLEDSDLLNIEHFWKVVERENSAIVFNRFDDELWKNEIFQDLYGDYELTSIPSFPVRDVFNSQYKGTFINGLKQYQKFLSQALTPIEERLLPKELLKKRKRKGLMKGLLQKRVQISAVSNEGGKDS